MEREAAREFPKNFALWTPNREKAAVFSLSSAGGEGWGEEAISSTPGGRFVERAHHHAPRAVLLPLFYPAGANDSLGAETLTNRGAKA